MAQEHLLQKLQEKFEGYTASADQVVDVRARIAQHIQDLDLNRETRHDTGPVPNHVQGLRREYIQASKASSEARQRLTALKSQDLDDSQQQPEPVILDTHLDVLKLRHQHQKYDSISHCAHGLEVLAEQKLIFNTETDAKPKIVTNQALNIDASGVEDLVSALEKAVLRANYQLQRERQLLEILKSRSTGIAAPLLSQLGALEATRTELTNWIETSLARCDQSSHEPVEQVLANNEDDGMTETKIDDAYQEYCRARSRLSSAVSTLSEAPSPINLQKQDMTRIAYQPINSILPTIEAQHLPLWGQSNMIFQHSKFIADSIQQDEHELAEKLSRLHDESHLIPAYPLLKKEHHRSKSKTDVTESDHEYVRMLEAWKFADEAAQITTSEGIIKHSTEGHEATNLAMETLQTLKLQSDMWQQLTRK